MKKNKYFLLLALLCTAQLVFAQVSSTDNLNTTSCLQIASVQKPKAEANTATNTSTTVAPPEEEKKSKWGVSFDVSLVSRFIWRGLELGDYASVQPNVTFSNGGFFTGIWSSHALSPAETAKNNITGYKEIIPYIGYGFKLGEKAKMSLMVLNHYNPNAGDFFNFDSKLKKNRVELRVPITAGKFDIMGSADVINDPSGNTSVYIELGYTVDVTNGVKVRPLASFTPTKNYYTTDGKANITQLGFVTSKEFKITTGITLPVKVDMIYNPDRKNFYAAFGVTAKF